MNIHLNRKRIIEKCGTVSFKRGEAFYRANKVNFNRVEEDSCEATVQANEPFYVTIETTKNGTFRSSCSCPSLASFSKDCQHIAAVLLALHEKKNNTHELTEGLFNLFQVPTKRKSGYQRHFEDRTVVPVTFIMKALSRNENHQLWMEIKVNEIVVKNIRGFLEKVKDGISYPLSSTFRLDFEKYCFSKETDAVIQLLTEAVTELDTARSMLQLAPSIFKRLLPLLENGVEVEVLNQEQHYQGFTVTDEALPLAFSFIEKKGRYLLKVAGLDRMLNLPAYTAVFYEGKFRRLTSHDCKRLSELKRTLALSKSNEIPIPTEQLNFFLEKVVPGLKQLGRVDIAEGLRKEFVETPLVAKLYLDRIKNRLLASLEFHYDHIVINPLRDQDAGISGMFIRDTNKEQQILDGMEDFQFTKTESGYFLHNEELEYEFLTYGIPKLEKLANIYSTTAVRNRVIREKAQPKIRVKVKKERTNWLEFKFELTGIADDEIRDLLAALEEKRKYYRLRSGTLMSLETKEFAKVNRFLQGLPTEADEVANGLSMPIEQILPMLDSLEDDEVFIQEETFREFLDRLKNPNYLNFAVPKSLSFVLRDYQVQGFQWLKTLASYGFGGVLADDMGLGKTLQSIAFILSELKEIRKNKQPVLIVCPSSVTYNWLSEFMKFAQTIDVIVMDGKKKDRIDMQKKAMDHDVIITSYPILRRDYQWFEKKSFHTVFFDEAQAFKNPVTQTYRAAKKIDANHRFALTGTPIENSLEELWSIYNVIFPGLFKGLQEYSHLTRKTIARRIRPFLLRRMKHDVLHELPEKKESIESLDLLPEQKKLYAAYLAKLRHDTLKHLDRQTFRKNKIRILAGLTRLRQICCHPKLFVDDYQGSSAKFDHLLQLVEEAKEAGRRVLIFSQFTKMLDLIGRELAKKGNVFFYLDGQTPAEERVEKCNRFNNGERNVFLISLKAGGTGLNLTGADTVIMFDSWWNPAVEEQAADRAYRMGQRNDVQVIKLVARGTIEEKMSELQEKKRTLIQEVIDSEDSTNPTITEEDIREILMI